LDESFLRDTIGKKMFLQLKIGRHDKINFFRIRPRFRKNITKVNRVLDTHKICQIRDG